MAPTKSYNYIPLFISLLIAGAIRIYFSFATPLIETDGAVVLLNARQFALTGKISLDSSLEAVILGFLYKIFGEHLIVGKILETVVALLTIIVAYFFCVKAYNLRVAFLSSLIISFFPLGIIFSYLCKGYTFTTLLVITSAFLLYLSVEGKNYLLSIFAGIAASLCFFFRTFSIACIAGVMLWFIADLTLKFAKGKKISFVNKSLFIFLLSSALFLLPVFIFRIRQLGFYFFRDFGMPVWLQSMEHFYRGLWENICDYHSIIYFIFIPAFIFFPYLLMRVKENRFPNMLIMVFTLSYVTLAVINQGHHFPRILVPAIPVMCILIAVVMDSVSDSSSIFYSPSILVTSVLASIFYLYFKNRGPFNTSLENLSGILKMTFYVFISYLLMALLSFIISKRGNIKPLFDNKYVSTLGTFVLIIIIAGYGSRYTYLRTRSLASWINGYIQALKFIPQNPGALLVYENAPFANLMGFEAYNFRDLDIPDGISMIRGNVEGTARRYFMKFFIAPPRETDDKVYFTYREMSRRFTGKDPEFHSRLETSESINRIYDNGNIAVFFYPYKETSPSPIKLKHIPLDSLTGETFEFKGTEVYFQISGMRDDLKIDLPKSEFIKIYENSTDLEAVTVARYNTSSFIAGAKVFGDSDNVLFPPNRIPIGIGDSVEINGNYFTLLSISKESRDAYFSEFPSNMEYEKAKFSFAIVNHERREEDYTYHILPEDLSIKPASITVPGNSSKSVEIEFALKKPGRNKVEVRVISQSSNRAYLIYFWAERAE